MNKKTKKKIVLFLVILSMVFLMSGCNSGGSDDNSSAKTQFVTVMTGIIPEGVEKETNNILPTGVIKIKGISPEEKSEGMYKFRLKKNNDYTATISDTNDIFETRNIKFNSGNGSSVIYLTTSSMLNGLSINVADSLGNITTNESLSIEGSDLQKISDGKYNASLKEGETYKLISNENEYFKAKEKSFEFTGQESIDFELERKEYEYTVEIRDSQNNLIPTAEIDDPAFEETSTEGVFKATLKAGLDYDIHITDSNNIYEELNYTINSINSNFNDDLVLEPQTMVFNIKLTVDEGYIKEPEDNSIQGLFGDLVVKINDKSGIEKDNNVYEFEFSKKESNFHLEIYDLNEIFERYEENDFTLDGETTDIKLNRKTFDFEYWIEDENDNLLSGMDIYNGEDKWEDAPSNSTYWGLKAGLVYEFEVVDPNGVYESSTETVCMPGDTEFQNTFIMIEK